jgi:outer membrane lipoprotein LolB
MGLLLLAGCSTVGQRPIGPSSGITLNGRLALTIDTQERQTFSGEFELQGSPAAGGLRILGPLGQTLIEATWTPYGAQLLRPLPARQFDTMAALTEATLGAAVPVPALMQWLESREATSTPLQLPDWQLDDTRRNTGRLTAVRTQPAPRVELRIILEPGSNTDNHAP